jgi:hypothetical protein
MSFTTLGLSQKVLSAIEAAGYSEPTPIQAQAIPHALEARMSGHGPDRNRQDRSFVAADDHLAGTRPRPGTHATHADPRANSRTRRPGGGNFNKYGVNHKLNVALLIGGVSFDEQEPQAERGADVLIATPGRLLDHFERGKLLLTGVESSSSTRPTGCSTWASCPTSNASLN